MRDEQFNQLARKPLSEQAKKQGYDKIQSYMKKTKRKDRIGYATVLVLFTCLFFVFIQTLKAPSPTDQIASELSDLGKMKEVTVLRNERADKQFDITSIFYSHRVVTTDQDRLTALEQQFESATTKPFEKDLADYDFSYDLVIEFDNKQSRYVKVLYGAGPIITLDMETGQSYQITEGNLGSTIEGLYYSLKSEETFFSWNVLLAMGLLIVVLLYQWKSSEGTAKKQEEEQTSFGIGITTAIIFFVPYLLMDRLFGSTHLAFLLLWLFGLIFCQDALAALKNQHPVNWNKLLLNNLLLMTILFFFFL